MALFDCGCASFSHEHPPDAVCGMTLDWLVEGQEVALGRWRCLIREPGWSEEKAQLYHVISFVHEGGFVIRDTAGSRVAEPSAAVVFYPGAPYQTAHPFGCGDHGSAIAVRRDLFREIAPEAEERTTAWTASIGSQAFWAHRLRVRRFLRGGQREAMPVLEETLLIVDEVTKQIRRNRRNDQRSAAEQRRRRERAEAVKLLLLEKLEQPVQLTDIADSVGTSVFHLCRCFREETGVPIHRYLQRLRLRAALASAIEDRSDLGEIALRFGFSSHSHFTAAFRQEFGLSPSAARRLGNG
jgi:AraC family transcriptional regulator